MKKGLVLLSGGQDSVTCLHVALKECGKVTAISFNYSQKHKVELTFAQELCGRYGIPLQIVDIPFLANMSNSGLVNHEQSVEKLNEKGLPNSFVPNRNALFLTIAHTYAQQIFADIIYIGACQTDYSGYPDCRKVFIDMLQDSLNIGSDSNIEIATPLMYLSKAETFQLAEQLGCLDTIIQGTHTCYNGVRDTLYEWGYGCGECPACLLRKKGFQEYKQQQ